FIFPNGVCERVMRGGGQMEEVWWITFPSSYRIMKKRVAAPTTGMKKDMGIRGLLRNLTMRAWLYPNQDKCSYPFSRLDMRNSDPSLVRIGWKDSEGKVGGIGLERGITTKGKDFDHIQMDELSESPRVGRILAAPFENEFSQRGLLIVQQTIETPIGPFHDEDLVFRVKPINVKKLGGPRGSFGIYREHDPSLTLEQVRSCHIINHEKFLDLPKSSQEKRDALNDDEIWIMRPPPLRDVEKAKGALWTTLAHQGVHRMVYGDDNPRPCGSLRGNIPRFAAMNQHSKGTGSCQEDQAQCGRVVILFPGVLKSHELGKIWTKKSPLGMEHEKAGLAISVRLGLTILVQLGLWYLGLAISVTVGCGVVLGPMTIAEPDERQRY
ncbi:hypothetical protein BJ684DRAFT_18139, partial [Piptocephalis cylindrospora]